MNKRLAGDITEDPEHPKIQFPSELDCLNCRINGNWNETAVFMFLVKFYTGIDLPVDLVIRKGTSLEKQQLKQSGKVSLAKMFVLLTSFMFIFCLFTSQFFKRLRLLNFLIKLS